MERGTVRFEDPEGVQDNYVGRSQLERTVMLPETAAKKEEWQCRKNCAEGDCYEPDSPWRQKKQTPKRIVQGLMAETCTDWRQRKGTCLDGLMNRNQVQKPNMYWQKSFSVARKSVPKPKFPQTGKRAFDVTRPPYGPKSFSLSDACSRVRELSVCFTLTVEKSCKGKNQSQGKEDKIIRIDLQAEKKFKAKGKEVNTGLQILGEIPGVEVGDVFQYRVELALVVVHRLYQAGIDFMDSGGLLVATSIVASGAYDDDVGDARELIYSCQGGDVVGKVKIPEDQKLVKGNLTLKNSISRGNPLVRIPGQPELMRRQVQSSKSSKVLHGVCVHDITEGKESLPITAVNTIDGAKPQPFKFIKKMMYPVGFHPASPKGCNCKDEYLFGIGQNYSGCTVDSSGQAILNELVEEGGYTIDAAHYGNVERFINHSCSPNLYAQNVVYDHKDKRMLHIMLFAADNIPPLTELSYHYNYSVDQFYDTDMQG
ncbi:histone-lysine N-methyltransferase, H3 lysine-9 specific SUVH6-like [Capsicum annuum]|uniref:histone-lysine N-methyltransferase, H3 lysine-9 specific SUVH6-like n=1 Tax=Capsicum annuum TaxID=4072 RepID=UPI001FB0DF69|nr:histone-lysine N-methyltransferase, H3 lysine-9 specific SUVH6-like [Capsicum annuum]